MDAIAKDLLRLVDQKPGIATAGADIATKHGISRQAVHKRIKNMVNDGTLVAIRKGKKTELSLKTAQVGKKVSIANALEEDLLWRELAHPILEGIGPKAMEICSYSFTEMVNNARDHSEGKELAVVISRTALNVLMMVVDDGIGVFKKITEAMGLHDMRESVLELSKGKFTTDSKTP